MYIHIDMHVIIYHLSHQGSPHVCVYVNKCMYVFMYTYICIYMHVLYMCIYMHVCVYVCIHMFKYIHMYILGIRIIYKVKESVSYSVMSDFLRPHGL